MMLLADLKSIQIKAKYAEDTSETRSAVTILVLKFFCRSECVKSRTVLQPYYRAYHYNVLSVLGLYVGPEKKCKMHQIYILLYLFSYF